MVEEGGEGSEKERARERDRLCNNVYSLGVAAGRALLQQVGYYYLTLLFKRLVYLGRGDSGALQHPSFHCSNTCIFTKCGIYLQKLGSVKSVFTLSACP